MITNQQYRRLLKLLQTEKTKALAAAKSGMDVKTARKYIKSGESPSELSKQHAWQTREDPFSEDWDVLKTMLEANPGFEAKTLFAHLQRQHPGKYQDGQLRTLQRKVKTWRATEGPSKEVFFPQNHTPGETCQSDFTYMDKLGIRIQGQIFEHMLYHFILPYSNWETGTICFSESMQSLQEGFQNALFQLGGVPKIHQTDSLSAAVRNMSKPKEFTQKYQALLRHFSIDARKTNPASPHENGDIEQCHNRLKNAIEQALLLRGNRNFSSQEAYRNFLEKLFKQLNSGRKKRFLEEQTTLRQLPHRRLESCERIRLRVGSSSTIRVKKNVYSVHSRLIGEKVELRIFADHLDLWYGQKKLDTIPRLRGEAKACINYRHIIDWLVRKPGAFANFRYRHCMFPTHRFRVAYDQLGSDKHYLKLLYLAARKSESGVDAAIEELLQSGQKLSVEAVEARLETKPQTAKNVEILAIALTVYDSLLRKEQSRCGMI